MNKKDNPKYIYLQWHFTTHGIAYMKHILASFYKGIVNLNQFIKSPSYQTGELKQEELHKVFDTLQKGFLFDKIYYFYLDTEYFKKLTLHSVGKKEKFLTEDEILKSNKELLHIWKRIYDEKASSLEEEMEYIDIASEITEELRREAKEIIWRNIHHYSVEDQLMWFQEYSNAGEKYAKRFTAKKLRPPKKTSSSSYTENPLRDYVWLASEMKKQMDEIVKKYPDAYYIINPVLCSREVQVVWFTLANAGYLPGNTYFIETYDLKDKAPGKRFKPFIIKRIASDIISDIHKALRVTLFRETHSPKRKIVQKEMDLALESGFSILLLGERGIGKTSIAKESSKRLKGKFVHVNCASFKGNISLAESLLFGYVKGAFTGAEKDTEGYFQQAGNNGILFLDEVHTLEPAIQQKLLLALQTDENNQIRIRKLGAQKEDPPLKDLRIIFASNKTIRELQQKLLPDFYDRIAQNIIEIPSLRETPEDLPKILESIWEQLKFDKADFQNHLQKDEKLKEWLQKLPLHGNYRDIQAIVRFYKQYLDMKRKEYREIKEYYKTQKGCKNAFEYTKYRFEAYIQRPEENEEALFNLEEDPNKLIKRYKKLLARKLLNHFGSAKQIEKYFKAKGSSITRQTIYKWKNG